MHAWEVQSAADHETSPPQNPRRSGSACQLPRTACLLTDARSRGDRTVAKEALNVRQSTGPGTSASWRPAWRVRAGRWSTPWQAPAPRTSSVACCSRRRGAGSSTTRSTSTPMVAAQTISFERSDHLPSRHLAIPEITNGSNQPKPPRRSGVTGRTNAAAHSAGQAFRPKTDPGGSGGLHHGRPRLGRAHFLHSGRRGQGAPTGSRLRDHRVEAVADFLDQFFANLVSDPDNAEA